MAHPKAAAYPAHTTNVISLTAERKRRAAHLPPPEPDPVSVLSRLVDVYYNVLQAQISQIQTQSRK